MKTETGNSFYNQLQTRMNGCKRKSYFRGPCVPELRRAASPHIPTSATESSEVGWRGSWAHSTPNRTLGVGHAQGQFSVTQGPRHMHPRRPGVRPGRGATQTPSALRAFLPPGPRLAVLRSQQKTSAPRPEPARRPPLKRHFLKKAALRFPTVPCGFLSSILVRSSTAFTWGSDSPGSTAEPAQFKVTAINKNVLRGRNMNGASNSPC